MKDEAAQDLVGDVVEMDDMPSSTSHSRKGGYVSLDTEEHETSSVSKDATSVLGTEPDDTALFREVEYKGEVVKLYPFNYKTVPRVKWQILSCIVLFVVFGMNDQSVGTLIPTLTAEYNVSAVVVSNIFLVQLLGYTVASFYTEPIHRAVGMRGCLIFACLLCFVFFTILIIRPASFWVVMFCSLPLGLGIGVLDATANVFMGNLVIHKNEWMGILHGLYGAAAMATPPLVSYFVEWGHWSWFFIIPLGFAILGAVIVVPSFKYETANKYKLTIAEAIEASDDVNANKRLGFFALLSIPAIFLHALYMFMYLGAEIATGAWFYTFLLETKLDNKIAMSYVSASFWTGLTVGRLTLGFANRRLFANEYRATKAYGYFLLVFYTLFVGVGAIKSHSVAYFVVLYIIMFFCGVFIGPLFPNASLVALQVLPKNLHISGIGIAVAMGGCGGALLPYLVGVAIHTIGVQFMPIICWFMVCVLVAVWTLYPRFIKGHEEHF